MANFSINFTGFDEQDPMVAIGVIRLGEDHEYFESVLGFWGLDDYKAIWTAGLRRLIFGASTSCLATSVTDPSSANFVEVWPLCRGESDVYALTSVPGPSRSVASPSAPTQLIRPSRTATASAHGTARSSVYTRALRITRSAIASQRGST